MRKFLIIMATLAIACTATLAGCSVHKLEVEQGNVFTPEQIAQIKPGMTRRQVQFLLGTPLIVDPFRRDRWDYIHSLSRNGIIAETQRVTVLFEGDLVSKTEVMGIQ